jgi:23S rRNA (adenine2030-N6)-methyltransferase
MNYRHSYHAGNFADVLKHAVLARIIAYMKQKEAPFRVIDTHAGAGRYALTSPQAEKTGEWLGGIGRILGHGAEPLPPAVERLLEPYLNVVRQENSGAHRLEIYPGSPAIALSLLRAQDALIVNELHPEERQLLQQAVGKDRRVKIMHLDAWVALKALLPPRERRGVILIDPPFEARNELMRLQDGLAQSLRRFAGGVYVIWYPIKDPRPIARFHAALTKLALPRSLRVELMLQPPADIERLNGCGLLIINAPYTLQGELSGLLPELSRRLAVAGSAGSFRLESGDAAGVPRASAPKRRTRTGA